MYTVELDRFGRQKGSVLAAHNLLPISLSANTSSLRFKSVSALMFASVSVHFVSSVLRFKVSTLRSFSVSRVYFTVRVRASAPSVPVLSVSSPFEQ